MEQLKKARDEVALNRIDESHPLIDSTHGQYRVCSVGNPMPIKAANIGCRWEHPEDSVHEVECGSDYYARYRCDNCGYEWKSELPE